MRLLRALIAAAALALGATAGVAATLVHQRWWGLVLGLAAGAMTTLALPPSWGRLAFAVGWLAMVVRLAWPRVEGDYLVAANGVGYALLAGSFGLVLVALASLPRRQRLREDRAVSPGAT